MTFPTGPLIVLEGAQGLDGRNTHDLSWNIASYFEAFFEDYRSDNFAKLSENIVDKFIKDQDKTYKLLKKKVEAKIKGYYAKQRWLFNELDYIIRLGLYHPYFSSLSGSIREQLEIFARSRESSINIEFDIINPSTKDSLSIRITKQELIGIGFTSWGEGQALVSQEDTVEYHSLKLNLIKKNVENIADYFEKIISATSLKKVRFIPLFDTGKTGFGYQVMERTGDASSHKYLPESGFYEVRLSDPNHREILKHIGYLIHSGKCAFVMKEWDTIKIDDLQEYLKSSKTMIGAWDRYGVLSPKYIYSVQNPKQDFYQGYNNFHIEVDEYSTAFKPTYIGWRANFDYPFVLSTAGTSDMYKYLSIVLKDETLKEILDL